MLERIYYAAIILCQISIRGHGLAFSISRREAWFGICTTLTGCITASPASAASAIQDSLDVESFLRTGFDTGGNMGVSSQAGKKKPETGVFLRWVYRFLVINPFSKTILNFPLFYWKGREWNFSRPSVRECIGRDFASRRRRRSNGSSGKLPVALAVRWVCLRLENRTSSSVYLTSKALNPSCGIVLWCRMSRFKSRWQCFLASDIWSWWQISFRYSWFVFSRQSFGPNW